jgi:hypothetical protein
MSSDEEGLEVYGSWSEADREESPANDDTEAEGTPKAGSNLNVYQECMDEISSAEDSNESDEEDPIELAPELQNIKGIFTYFHIMGC